MIDGTGKIYIGNNQVTPLLLNKVEGGVPTTGFLVQVIDYDGTVLKSERLEEGESFTLPSQPSHTGLVFDGWSSPITITNNTVTVTNSDITIGPMFHTSSGLSEFDITLTEATGLNVTLNMNGIKNWGDGTSNTSTTHTYASVGDYTITCNGTTMTNLSGVGLFGQQTTSDINYYVKDVRLGSNITSISSVAFRYCYSLTSITIPSTVTSISSSAFYCCYSLTNIAIPEGVTSISASMCTNCLSLTSITLPSTITSIDSSAFYHCPSLTNVTIPEGVTNIGGFTFDNCYSLTSVTIPEGVTSIGQEQFDGCYSLTSITIPRTVTSINYTAFRNCYSILKYDFSSHTVIPTLVSTDVFTGINNNCKIYVPFSLYESWKVATNWSAYADYIYTSEPAIISFSVNPSGSDIYVRGSQIQGTSTSWYSTSAIYVVHDSTNNVVLTGTQTGITGGATVNITADLTTNYSKITLSTGITGLTAKFTIGEVTFDATNEGNGNYSINVVGSGDIISYSVKGEGYAKATGTITTTGSNITQNITMEPSTEEPWARPNLTANGTMGGDAFAVYCINPNFNEQTWMAVDDVTQDGYQTEWYGRVEESPDYIFYNPNPLKVTELKFVFGYRMSEGLSIYGSEDGSNWEEITSNYNSEPSYDEEIGMSYTSCTLTNDAFYNYYKLVFEGWDYVTITDLQITATQLV